MTRNRLGLTYDLLAESEVAARSKARDLVVEQTVEIPDGCYSDEIARSIVSRIEALEEVEEGCFRLEVTVSPALVGREIGQLFNVLFGNISLFRGVRLRAIDWPAGLLELFPGPRYGIAGLRRRCGVERRPLLCAAIKPVGKTPGELAADCADFALGGADLIKDDHSLANQASAPFAERIARCQAAVDEVNARTGGNTLYLPNLPGDPRFLAERLERLEEAGCGGVMLSPLLFGIEATAELVRSGEFVVLGHPTFSGAFFGDAHGIAPEVLFGDLYRLLGCDGVIYVNVGGRFGWTLEQCQAVNEALRRKLPGIEPAFPVPAGGVQTGEVGMHLERYGADTMVLIGGSLYQQGDLAAATARLREDLEDVA